ncbi:helix-turn-helix domain-containing protein [bacterium]|nr:helix-turn-helix domain-containing protein [bacterium]
MRKVERLALSVTEVAESLGISRAQAYKMVKSGELPSISVGTRRLIPDAWVREWMEEQRTQGSESSERGTAQP